MDITEKYRERSQAPELVLLRLQAFCRLNSLSFGLLNGALVLLLMLLPVGIMFPGEAFQGVLGIALFFSASIAILSGFTSPVFRGAENDLAGLGPVLSMSAEQVTPLAQSLTRMTKPHFQRATLFAVGTGLAHSWLLGTFHLPLPYAISQGSATILLWTIMTWTIPALIMNALLFSRLGKTARPDLLRPSRQAGFGSAALRPALFMIGTLCAYPLLLLGNDDVFDGATLLGAFWSLPSILGIVILPLRGIRKRIREEREVTLAALDTRLDAISDCDVARANAQDLIEIDAVLDMRARVAGAPAWPIDLAGVKRILLYIVLPPLTWAAAALVEMLMNNVV